MRTSEAHEEQMMATMMQQPPTDLPPAMRGNRPADLHAYRRGRRMAPRDAQSSGALTNLRSSIGSIDEQRLARALGWFSVALGLAEVVAPRQLGRAIGIDANPNLLRAMGLREIASGVGILTQEQHAGWLWSRVAGDAMDLALLGAAMTSSSSNRTRLTAATAAVAGVTALDVYCSQQMTRSTSSGAMTTRSATPEPVRETVSVNASPEECYRI